MRKSKQKLFENLEELFEPETILKVGTGQVARLLLLGDHSPSLLKSQLLLSPCQHRDQLSKGEEQKELGILRGR